MGWKRLAAVKGEGGNVRILEAATDSKEDLFVVKVQEGVMSAWMGPWSAVSSALGLNDQVRCPFW